MAGLRAQAQQQELEQLIAAQFSAHAAIAQKVSAADIHQGHALYAKLDEVHDIQEEISRLRGLVTSLFTEIYAGDSDYKVRHHHRRPVKPPSDRAASLMGISTDEEDDNRTATIHTGRPHTRQRNRAEAGYVRGLEKLEPSDPKLTGMLSYRRHRLVNQDARLVSNVSIKIGVWTRRLDYVIGKQTFNSAKSVACLRFLSMFTKQLSNEGIPEAGDLRI